ncbi:MAG TPA: AbrB/MazE/SpoVT family DNA-binding domain-containing protein [Nitrospirota bacterium]
MKTHLIRVGNSRGIRLPKPLISQAGLTDEVELNIKEGAIVIENASSPRAGWAEAAKAMHNRSEDVLLMPSNPTRFDEKDWKW